MRLYLQMYRDQLKAPVSINNGPTIEVSPCEPPWEIPSKPTPVIARPHPNQVVRGTASPDRSDKIGVTTTEACVRKAPRVASVK
mmetsp:Transcript_2950/g.6904  ORF Transcript_2950/g.6904 Transcript_2950/m.6904 type:complete len:84 (-) Transcript_2950:528-779(-)